MWVHSCVELQSIYNIVSLLAWGSLKVAIIYDCLSPIFKRSVSATEQQCTTISIISDECVEDDETFHLQLSTEDESVMLNPATAYVTILNNDCKFWIDCLVVIEKDSRTYKLAARIATCTHTYYAFQSNPYNPES